jgi:hypothetical protein
VTLYMIPRSPSAAEGEGGRHLPSLANGLQLTADGSEFAVSRKP